MTENNDIPKHWQVKKLGEVCLTTSGGTPSRSQSRYFNGNIPWVKSGELDKGLILETEEKITEEALQNSSAKVFPKGTLLIALYGATIGKLAFLGVDAATNQAVCGIFKNDNINSKYLFHFLFYKKPTLVKQSIGGAQPNISQGILKNLGIPIPPLSEQQAIISKIEELLSDLENGKQQLQIAQQQLKIYRLSLLKWAFEGRLTNKIFNGELPNGWSIVDLKSIIDSIQYGYTESSSKNPIGPKFLRITDIQENKVIWDEVPYCKIDNEIKQKYLLKNGDLVFARTGATVGKSYLIKGNIPEAVFASYLIRVRVNQEINEKYLSWFFQSPNYWEQITEGQVGIGQPNVNGTKLGQLKITIAPLDEQQLIVDELESKLTICGKAEESISQSLYLAETLWQSILKKTFEGKLVPQDPNDEPVSKLLERIEKEGETYVQKQKDIKRILRTNKTIIMAEELKPIVQLLQESKKPINSKTLWQSSVHKDDIDAFYAQLKKLIEKGEIEEIERQGKESFIKLAEEK